MKSRRRTSLLAIGSCLFFRRWSRHCRPETYQPDSEILSVTCLPKGWRGCPKREGIPQKRFETVGTLRRARDSNPQALAGAGFQDRCNSRSSNSPCGKQREKANSLSPNGSISGHHFGKMKEPGDDCQAPSSLSDGWSHLTKTSFFVSTKSPACRR